MTLPVLLNYDDDAPEPLSSQECASGRDLTAVAETKRAVSQGTGSSTQPIAPKAASLLSSHAHEAAPAVSDRDLLEIQRRKAALTAVLIMVG